LETCFKPLYDHVRGKTIGLRLTTGTYTEIFTPSCLDMHSDLCLHKFTER
jgi:hypothetical protein